jgi:uncharacterized protein involved in oxidation of intracellular sulfur
LKALFIINDPLGMERVYNALRLGHALAKKDPTAEMTVFPMADAVLAAKGGQKSPRVSTTSNSDLMEGAQRSTMDELAAVRVEADKVLVL